MTFKPISLHYVPFSIFQCVPYPHYVRACLARWKGEKIRGSIKKIEWRERKNTHKLTKNLQLRLKAFASITHSKEWVQHFVEMEIIFSRIKMFSDFLCCCSSRCRVAVVVSFAQSHSLHCILIPLNSLFFTCAKMYKVAYLLLLLRLRHFFFCSLREMPFYFKVH